MDLDCAAIVVQRHFRALTCPVSSTFVVPGDRFRVVHNSNSSTLYSAKALYEYFDKYASDTGGQLQDPVVQRPYNEVEHKRLLDIIRKRPVRLQHRKRKLAEEMMSMHQKISKRANAHVRDSEDARRSAARAERNLLIEESISNITFDVVTMAGRLKENDNFMAFDPAEVSDILLPHVVRATESYLDCVVTFLAHEHPREECLQMHSRCSEMIENALKLLNVGDHVPSLAVWKAAMQFRQRGSPIIEIVQEYLNALTLDMQDYMTVAQDRAEIVRGAGVLTTFAPNDASGIMRIVFRRTTNRPPPPPLPEES